MNSCLFGTLSFCLLFVLSCISVPRDDQGRRSQRHNGTLARREEVLQKIKAANPIAPPHAVSGTASWIRSISPAKKSVQRFPFRVFSESSEKIKITLFRRPDHKYAELMRKDSLLQGAHWGRQAIYLKQASISQIDLFASVNGIPVSLKILLPIIRAEPFFLEWRILFWKIDAESGRYVIKFKSDMDNYQVKAEFDPQSYRLLRYEVERHGVRGKGIVEYGKDVDIDPDLLKTVWFPRSIVVKYDQSEIFIENNQFELDFSDKYRVRRPPNSIELGMP